MPFYTIDTWDEAERLLPEEDYGPPFWLPLMELIIAQRRMARGIVA